MNDASPAGTVICIADLPSLAGRHLGSSRWHRISQDQVDRFAEATEIVNGSTSTASERSLGRSAGRSPTAT